MKQLLSLAVAALFAMTASAQVTFNVDMTCAPADFDNVFVTGPWCGWCANAEYNTMTDDDGDGVYTVTVPDLTGTVEYKYAINGFADQENLVNDMVDGADCAPITDYNAYANRTIESGEGVVADDYYGTCDGVCNDAPPAPAQDVTFRVDMSQYAGSYNVVNIFGSFNGWCDGCAVLTDDDADMIYELTVSIPAGTIEYKFTLDGYAVIEEFAEGSSCTTTIDGFTNRSYEVATDVILPAVCWNDCLACGAEPTPGCTDATACNYNEDATEDDGSCYYGDGPAVGFSVMDALCFGETGGFDLDSATVALYEEGASFVLDTTAVVYGGLSGIETGTYTLYATDSLGCTSETTVTIGSPDELVVVASVVAGDPGDGSGQAEATISGGTPEYEVAWTNVIGTPVNPDSLATGQYTVTVTDANGCSASATLNMTADNVIEVLNLEGKVFPVPVKDVLNVQLAKALGSSAIVSILDVQGREVSNAVMRAGTQTLILDASSWTQGAYIIQIVTDEAKASWNFVK